MIRHTEIKTHTPITAPMIHLHLTPFQPPELIAVPGATGDDMVEEKGPIRLEPRYFGGEIACRPDIYPVSLEVIRGVRGSCVWWTECRGRSEPVSVERSYYQRPEIFFQSTYHCS